MEWEEGDGSILNASLNQLHIHTMRAEETCTVQPPVPETIEVFKSVSPCHAVIRDRPLCSPEYSPNFNKSGSALPHSTGGKMSHSKADTSVPLQPSTNTRMPYLEKKRLLDKQEEIQEVKKLDEWKPAVGIFTALLEGLNDKPS